jgi:hypothetical protein
MADENIHTDITVADIQLMLNVIDVCAKRGAFHASEFVPVGQLSQKLLKAIAPALEEKKQSIEQFELDLGV